MALFTDLQPVLTAATMREADRRTIEDLGLPRRESPTSLGEASPIAECFA
jgi:hypothetical protein